MGWKTDQFFPSPEIVQVAVDGAVLPAIAASCDQFGISRLAADVSVWSGTESRSEPCISASGTVDDGVHVSGHIRLRFRHTIKTGRVLFFAQLQVEDPVAAGGFAGMILRGQIAVEGHGGRVTTTSCTGVYNRSSWIDPASV